MFLFSTNSLIDLFRLYLHHMKTWYIMKKHCTDSNVKLFSLTLILNYYPFREAIVINNMPTSNKHIFGIMLFFYSVSYVIVYTSLCAIFVNTPLIIKYIFTVAFIFVSVWYSENQLTDLQMKKLFIKSDKEKAIDLFKLTIKIAPVKLIAYMLFIFLTILAQLKRIGVFPIQCKTFIDYLQVNEYAIILVIAFDRVSKHWHSDKTYRKNLFEQYVNHIRSLPKHGKEQRKKKSL